jgi:ankyrin repeat protein
MEQSVLVMETGGQIERLDDGRLLALFGAIASGDYHRAALRLDESPDLAARAIRVGATRQDADTYFLRPIGHYVYEGDTALHVAAAAHQPDLARSLVTRGANVRARNRRGAQPLHYAADGSPRAANWKPDMQCEVIRYLIEAGADPDAMDKSGVAPIHRAVRTRSSDAVNTLIEYGADPRLISKSGSTPLHLAVQNTGKSGSGSDTAKDEQRRIITLLLGHGAMPTDVDGKGKTVAAAASSEWIRQLLHDS